MRDNSPIRAVGDRRNPCADAGLVRERQHVPTRQGYWSRFPLRQIHPACRRSGGRVVPDDSGGSPSPPKERRPRPDGRGRWAEVYHPGGVHLTPAGYIHQARPF